MHVHIHIQPEKTHSIILYVPISDFFTRGYSPPPAPTLVPPGANKGVKISRDETQCMGLPPTWQKKTPNQSPQITTIPAFLPVTILQYCMQLLNHKDVAKFYQYVMAVNVKTTTSRHVSTTAFYSCASSLLQLLTDSFYGILLYLCSQISCVVAFCQLSIKT